MIDRTTRLLGCEVQLRCLPNYKGLPLPQYMTEGASGLDLLAAVTDSIQLLPGKRVLIPTGIQIAIPEGLEGQVRPRSGLALKEGIGILNAPGTIDSDYRGEVQVILFNAGDTAFSVTRGMRIAQLVITPVVKAQFVLVDNLSTTHRGEGGFGHTGCAKNE
ncbi:MAG: dUTP diphosphatase [Candidatus Omnitrophica bacterium]|nr:dUTP diphosphatase [Candidatus Omnitrophota bacterium]